MKTKTFIPLLALAYLSTFTTFYVAQLSAAPLGTAFNYQGRLIDSNSPVQGIYDLRFAIYDALSGPSQIGPALTNAATGVTNGLFTVALDFGAGVFDGSARWLEIAVRTNGGDAFATLSPRQPLTPSPYALYAPSAGTMSGNPVVSGTTTFSPASGPPFLVSNTNKVVNLSADLLDGLESSAFWRTAGNAGTTPGVNFFGTTDNQPLEFKVNNQRVLRVENNGTSPNFVGGYSGNSVGANVYGATMSGGGQPGNINSVDAIYSTIGGGYGNAIRTNAGSSTIGGGALNNIGTNAHSSVIGGGAGNNVAANAAYGTIAGGVNNNIGTNSGQGTIAGGWSNNIAANSSRATIAGGEMNKIGTNCYASTIGGGTGNTIPDNSDLATIPGGGLNYAGHYAFAAGLRARASHNGTFVWGDTSTGEVIASTGINQFLIRAAGGVGIGTNNPQSALHVNGTVTASGFSGSGAALTGLGDANITSLSGDKIVGGDLRASRLNVGHSHTLSGTWATIAGGSDNHAGGYASVVAGGHDNSASGANSVVAGGWINTASGAGSFVGGGWGHAVGPFYYGNTASGSNSVVAGGYLNVASGNYSAVPGGSYNTASGDYSFAAGRRAHAIHDGSFVWGGSANFDVDSTANNQFIIRALNGVGINTASPQAELDVAGNVRAETVTITSDREAKQDFAAVDTKEILQRLASLPIQTWTFKQKAGTRHIGPVAQDFYAAFGVGADDKHIATVDADGAALAAIQGLNQVVKEKEARIEALEKEMAGLKSLVDGLVQKSKGGGL